MTEQFETRLIECLDALENQQSMDNLLTRYPDDAAELRRALDVAGALPTLALEPDAAAQAASRRAFLAQAEALSQKKARPAAGGGMVFARAGVMLGVILAAGAIPVAASENALPGDVLYSVKREVETVRLQLAPGDAERKALSDHYNLRRVQEIDGLLRSGRAAETEFVGRLEPSPPGEVKVDGRTITIPLGLELPALPPVGSLVEVTVRVQDGQLMLVSLTPVIEGEATPAAPAPTATVEPSAAPTLIPTSTSEPEDTHEPEIESTEDAEHTETPDDGEIEPTEDGGDDGGGDDGGGDDGGGDDGGGDNGGDDNSGSGDDNSGSGDDNSGSGGGNSGSGGGDDNSGHGGGGEDD